MMREVWPKDDESSITLRLAPPLRLEADGSGNPLEVWLKEDEFSDVTLRLEPFQSRGSDRIHREDPERGPFRKNSRKQGPRNASQEQGQSSNKKSDRGSPIATFHVHSAYPRRCKNSDTCLVERWPNTELSLELTLEVHRNPRACTICMELLSGPALSPSSVNVAHAIEVHTVSADCLLENEILLFFV